MSRPLRTHLRWSRTVRLTPRARRTIYAEDVDPLHVLWVLFGLLIGTILALVGTALRDRARRRRDRLTAPLES